MRRSKSHHVMSNAIKDSAKSEHDAVALIEKNYTILTQFKANMKDCKVVENTELLCHFRDNITQAIQLSSLKAVSLNLPPLPQLNLDLANKFLPPRLPLQGGSPSAASLVDAPASSFACMPPFGFQANFPPSSNSPAMYSMAGPSASHR